MTPGRPPLLAWPGWPHLCFAWTLSALNALWFAFVYGGCDWITARRAWRVRLDLPGELAAMPFVPWTVAFYMSVYGLFLIGPFVVRGRREFAALIGALALATFVGGIGFLLLPGQLAYPPPGNLGIWAGLFRAADRMNLDYNLAPALHVALSVCCVAAFARHAGPVGRRWLWAWAAAIAFSTLLTHQHYLVDAVSGWALGLAAQRATARMVPRRRTPSFPQHPARTAGGTSTLLAIQAPGGSGGGIAASAGSAAIGAGFKLRSHTLPNRSAACWRKSPSNS